MFIKFEQDEAIYYVFRIDIESVKKPGDILLGNMMLVIKVNGDEEEEMIAVSTNSDYTEVDIDTPPNSYYQFEMMIEHSLNIMTSFDNAKPVWNVEYTSGVKRKKQEDVPTTKKYSIKKILKVYTDGILCECKHTEGPRHFKFNKLTNLGIEYQM